MGDSHHERMTQASKFIVPSTINRPTPSPEVKAISKKLWDQAQAILDATMKNGAGLPMDGLIRSFYHEYCDRLWEGGLEYLPSSFNVLEALVRHDPSLVTFRLLPEKDHKFDGMDFLDFATGPNAPDDHLLETHRMKEGVIYSYNRADNPGDILFSSGTGKEFGFSGVSMVRRGDEVALVLLGGLKDDLEARTRELSDMEALMLRAVEPGEGRFRGAANLEGTNDMWRHLAIARFDVRTRVQQVRYLFRDIGDSYMSWTDDPDTGLAEEILQSQSKSLDGYSGIFEIAKTCLLLPAYFWFKRSDVTSTNTSTRLRGVGAYERKNLLKAGVAGSIFIRMVEAVGHMPSAYGPSGSYTAPAFQVEVNGFWRRLKDGSVGHDPFGQEVDGRTWVKAHTRWRDNPPAQKTIWVKRTIEP